MLAAIHRPDVALSVCQDPLLALTHTGHGFYGSLIHISSPSPKGQALACLA